MSDKIINHADFSPGQQEEIVRALEGFLQRLCLVAPVFGPHLLSGGTFEIKTMSSLTLKLGFNPNKGGIITPGGITPVNPTGRIF